MKVERALEALRARRQETLVGLGGRLLQAAREPNACWPERVAELNQTLDDLDEMLEDTPRARAIVEAAILRAEGKKP